MDPIPLFMFLLWSATLNTAINLTSFLHDVFFCLKETYEPYILYTLCLQCVLLAVSFEFGSMPSDEQGQTLNGSSVHCMVGSPTGGRDDDDDDDDDDADEAEVDLLKISKRRLKETTHVCHLCTLERL